MVLVVVFMFSVCFVHGSTWYIQEQQRGAAPGGDPEVLEDLSRYWGGILVAMDTLYQCSTGGRPWNEAADVLVEVGRGYSLLFVTYILFYLCVATNAIISLFVEATRQYSERDLQAAAARQLEQKDQLVEKLSGWYESIT